MRTPSRRILRRRGHKSQTPAGAEEGGPLLDQYPLRSDGDGGSTASPSVVSRWDDNAAPSASSTRPGAVADDDDGSFPYLSGKVDAVISAETSANAAAAAAAPFDEEQPMMMRLVQHHAGDQQQPEGAALLVQEGDDERKTSRQRSSSLLPSPKQRNSKSNPWTSTTTTTTTTTTTGNAAHRARRAVPFGSADDEVGDDEGFEEDGPPSEEEEEEDGGGGGFLSSSSLLLKDTVVRSDQDGDYYEGDGATTRKQQVEQPQQQPSSSNGIQLNRTAETIDTILDEAEDGGGDAAGGNNDDDRTVQRDNTTKKKSDKAAAAERDSDGNDRDDSGRFFGATSLLGMMAVGILQLWNCCFGWDSWMNIFDEDDVIAAATASTRDVTAFMAVAAAKNASNAVGTGATAAAAAAAAAAGGGAAGGAAGNASTATQAGVVVTAVAAASVVAGMAVTGDNGVSLVCPNVTNARVLPGSMAIDFMLRDGDGESSTTERRLTIDQAAVMGSTFVETYNEMFGCQSDYNRLIINCTIPCDEPVDGDLNSTSRFCCEQFDDPLFGDILRCSFNCFVHCSGCLESEPLFEEPVVDNSTSTITTLPETLEPLDSTTSNAATIDGSSGGVARLLQSDENCSPQCMIARGVEDVVCGEFFNESSCVAIRSFTMRSYPFATTASPGESNFSIVTETEFVDPPSAQPSTAPSITGSMSPSVSPSQEPTMAPSLRPSDVPTLRPSNSPTPAPSQGPSLAPTTLSPTKNPTRAPSGSPTRAPSALPTLIPTANPTQFNAIVDLVLYNGDGGDLGSLIGRTRVWIQQVGAELTVRAMVADPDAVDRVDFYLDGSLVNREDIEPYYLNKDEKGVGTPFPPLAVPGEHNVTALAEKDGVQTGRKTAIFRVIPNDVDWDATP